MTDNQKQVEVAPGPFSGVLKDLTQRYPELGTWLPVDDAHRGPISIFIDSDDFRSVGGLAADVRDGQTVSILAAVAGG